MDKVRNKKMTPLKRAILRKRALKFTAAKKDDSFETVSEHSSSEEDQIETNFVKYKRVFDDLDKVAAEVEQMICQPSFASIVRQSERKQIDTSKGLVVDALRENKGKANVREYVDMTAGDDAV